MSSNVGALLIEPPDSEAAIRKAVETEQRRHRAWFDQQSRNLEKLRDRNLKQLDQTARLFQKGFSEPQQAESSGKSKNRHKRSAKTTPAQIEGRLKGVYRFLLEKGKPTSCPEIRRALNLTSSQACRALSRLIRDGMVTRSGTGSGVRYEAKPGKQNRIVQTQGAVTRAVVPLDVQMLDTIRNRGEATPDELARKFRVPFEHVQRSCGELIRRNQVVVDIRDGRHVYTAAEAA